METGIGAILRDARNRRKISLADVKAATQIRVRYLRAIENEEWDVLPGGVYTRSFIRTYAGHLGLDGERLAEDFRRSESQEAAERPPLDRLPRPSRRARRRLPSVPARAWALLISAGLVAAVIAIGLSGGDEGPEEGGSAAKRAVDDGTPVRVPAATPERPGVSVELAATGEVWVCVLDAGGRPLVDGQILSTGGSEGPFRSGSFTLSFGNGEVSMSIDGKQAEIPATSSPIGYEIDSAGRLTELSEGERPTCT